MHIWITSIFCSAILKEGEDTLELEDPETQDEKEKLKEYLEIMSRGGLSKPSDMLFLTSLFIHSLWTHMNHFEEEKEDLWASANPRATAGF